MWWRPTGVRTLLSDSCAPSPPPDSLFAPTLSSGPSLSSPGPSLPFFPWVSYSLLRFFPILSRSPPLFSPLGHLTLHPLSAPTLLRALALCPSQPYRHRTGTSARITRRPPRAARGQPRRLRRPAGLRLAAKLGKCRLLEPRANGRQGRDLSSGAGSGEATKGRSVAARGLEQLPEPLDGPPPPPRHGRE